MLSKGKGFTLGAVNYKHDLLIDIVEELLPNGALGWQRVCQVYHQHSGEENICNWEQVRKNRLGSPSFCNGNEKPMGKKGGKDDRVHHCIAIEPKIMEKMSSGMLGNSLPEKQHNSDEDDDDVSREDGNDDEEDYVDYGYSPGKAPPSDVEDQFDDCLYGDYIAEIGENPSFPALPSLNLAEGVFVLPLVGPLACTPSVSNGAVTTSGNVAAAAAATGVNTFNYERIKEKRKDLRNSGEEE